MGMIETSPTTIVPWLLRNLVTTFFIYADKSFVILAEKYKLLEIIRYVLETSFLLFLRLLPSVLPYLNPNIDINTFKPSKSDTYLATCGGYGDSGIARALSQLLSILNEIPVSSRKYEFVRSLAERLIDENHRENIVALHEVNRGVLSTAFSSTLSQLEATMAELGRDRSDDVGSGSGPVQYRSNRMLKVVRSVRETASAWTRAAWGREDVNWSGISAEKLAAELVWLAQKMAACGFGEEAVRMWASASNLAWLSLSAEPRLQCCLVKASASLFKQAKEMGVEEIEEAKKEQHRQTKLKMLMSWLPLLCRASYGTDVPVLSSGERAELERILEETIEMLDQEEEQEQVFSLWLQHYTHCPSTDWPNLHASYARWCTASRKLLLLQ